MKNRIRGLGRFLRSKLGLLFCLIAIVYLAACVYVWSIQTQSIFEPIPEVAPSKIKAAFEGLNITFERKEIPLVTSDGDQIALDAIWIPAKSGGAINDAPTLLFLHGSDDTIGKYPENDLKQLHELNYNVLFFDYRGFGKSFGKYKPSERSVYEDAEAAWQFLITELGADPKRTIIFGHSLGGAIAVELATHHPEAGALIVVNTFTSVIDVSKEMHGGLPKLLPLRLLIRNRFETKEKMGDLKLPVLLIHGTADETAPPEMSVELHRLAPEPKELVLIEGGEHANTASVGAEEYKDGVSAFVREHIRPAATPAP